MSNECTECGAALHACCGFPRELWHDPECRRATPQTQEERVRRAACSFIRALDEFGLDPSVLGEAFQALDAALTAPPAGTPDRLTPEERTTVCLARAWVKIDAPTNPANIGYLVEIIDRLAPPPGAVPVGTRDGTTTEKP